MPPINLKDLFLGLQEELTATLQLDRDQTPHPGNAGDSSEGNWVEMLSKYLPTRYQVEKAQVVDADGNLSDQMDIVIFDRQYCPFLFRRKGTTYVPAESVYAVLEAKQVINKGMIEYAGDKAASVRKLRRTSVAITHAGGTYAPKPLHPILAGIVALDSDWNPPMGDPLLKALCEADENHRLDIGCSLKHGSFEMIYPQGSPPLKEQSEQETALIFFVLRLSQRLQQMGTVPAIDLKSYGHFL